MCLQCLKAVCNACPSGGFVVIPGCGGPHTHILLQLSFQVAYILISHLCFNYSLFKLKYMFNTLTTSVSKTISLVLAVAML